MLDSSLTLDLLKSLGGNSSGQEILQVVVVDNLTDVGALVLGKIRLDTVGVCGILSHELSDVLILRLDSLSDASSNGRAKATEASAHSL